MRTILILCGCWLLAAPARAQLITNESVVRERSAVWRGGITIGVMTPGGDFSQRARPGGIGDAFLSRHSSDSQPFGLRADFAVTNYSSTDHRTTLHAGDFGDVGAAVKQEDDIYMLTFGPELARPSGRVRPYVRAGVGAAVVIATVSLAVDNPDSSGNSSTLSRSPMHDVALAYAISGGVDVGIAKSLLLDIGVGVHGTGPVSYYGRGKLPDGSVTSLAGPFHSPTRMYALMVGIRWR